jgi:hypothetical protein
MASPAPTTGVERRLVGLPSGKSITVKEVGGAVMGLWPKYMTDDVVGVLVFLDASNRCQVPEVLVDLMSVIKHDRFGLLVRYSM